MPVSMRPAMDGISATNCSDLRNRKAVPSPVKYRTVQRATNEVDLQFR